ncbi:MAG: HK97 family phage prohead protease [Phycisphaerales bacterium]|nr:MAG: HK97 family phage prohead protease [Phycisphaerales bacterium]
MTTNRRITEDTAQGVRIETREDGTRRLTGYAAVYYDGTPGTQYRLWKGAVERILPGAFDSLLASGPDVRALFNHDSDKVLGRTRSGTLTITADTRGLHYDIVLPNTAIASDLAVSVERGDVSGSSFSFGGAVDEWRREGEMEIREIRGFGLVLDVGPVTFPAYDATTVGARADEPPPALRCHGEPVEARAAYEAWRAAEAEGRRVVVARGAMARARAVQVAQRLGG